MKIKEDYVMFGITAFVISAFIGVMVFLYMNDENRKQIAIQNYAEGRFGNQYDRYRCFEYHGNYYIIDTSTNEFCTTGGTPLWKNINEYMEK